MAGLRVPVVIFPRFTSFIGATTYTSLALDVAAYSSLELSIWRGPLVGTTPSFAASLYDSMDRDNWTLGDGPANVDPGQNVEQQYVWQLTERWLRISLLLGGTTPGTTCWAAGFLVKRER